MGNSVNTNFGAIVALQSLNKTNSELESVQKRVSTGYRVNDAIDDGAAFAVARAPIRFKRGIPRSAGDVALAWNADVEYDWCDRRRFSTWRAREWSTGRPPGASTLRSSIDFWSRRRHQQYGRNRR